MTNCTLHPEVESVAYCVSCGNALCPSCRMDVEGTVYCEKCLGEMVRAGSHEQSSRAEEFSSHESSSTRQESGVGENPGAAFAIGLIPGVGAIFNGEFIKAGIHILIFGILISLAGMRGTFEAVFTLMVFGFYFYMPFEAYYTAKKRKLRSEGIELETPIDRFQKQVGEIQNRELWGGVALVVLGMIFLADNFTRFELSQVTRFWPIVLIGAGIWLVLKHRDQPDSDDRRTMYRESVPEESDNRRKEP